MSREPLIALVAVALAVALVVGCWLGRLRERRDLCRRAQLGLPRQLGPEMYYLVPLSEYRLWQSWKARHTAEVESWIR